MLGAVSASTSLCFSPSIRIKTISKSTQSLNNVHSFSLITPPSLHFSLYHTSKAQPHFFPQASSSSSSISGEIMHSLSFIFRFHFFLFCFFINSNFYVLVYFVLKINNAEWRINFNGSVCICEDY
jgi:hypothetical protein